MTSALQSYDTLRAAGFSDTQARAILAAMAGDLVTRDHLDARLEALERRLSGRIEDLSVRIEGVKNQLLIVLIGGVGLILGSIYFVLPRLVAQP